MSPQKQVIVHGAFDDLRSGHLRFIEEASRFGDVTVALWSDEMIRSISGQSPKFPLAERSYFLNAVRYVARVLAWSGAAEVNALPMLEGLEPQVWVDVEPLANSVRETYCRRRGMEYCVLPPQQMDGFPAPPAMPSTPGRKKVIVTGCYDWFHSGHVRFCEEVSAYGDLYVAIGNDRNIQLLKGAGHPLLSEAERCYVVGSIKYVKQALISSGEGWLDADPEIQWLKPDIYAVNEDGDKGGKRDYCAKRGIEYLVLKRTPAPGLQIRSSTDLRGF